MARRAIQLGEENWNYLLCILIEKGLSPHRKADLENVKILRYTKKMNLVLYLDALCCY